MAQPEPQSEPLSIEGPEGPLSGELLMPGDPRAVLLLAHGAGAGYRHPTLLAIAEALARVGIGSGRFNFPFMQAGRRRTDAPAIAVAAIAAAAATVTARSDGLPLYAGGHSFGGRMTSHAVAEGAVRPDGLVFMSFPLHPANRPAVSRAAHLTGIEVPMLFLSGTRDALAEAELLQDVIDGLGERATLHWLDDADHSYKTRKRVRRDSRIVFDEMADTVREFVDAAH